MTSCDLLPLVRFPEQISFSQRVKLVVVSCSFLAAKTKLGDAPGRMERLTREASAAPQGASSKAAGWLEVWPEAGGQEVRRSPAEMWSGRQPVSPRGRQPSQGVKAEGKRLMHF